MDALPYEIIEHIFCHLDAFDAHRFGLTQRRVFEVITRQRELANISNVDSLYDIRWFDDVKKVTDKLCKIWSKIYAEDEEFEYAPSLREDIQQCEEYVGGDGLYELITGTYYDGDWLDLEDFVENHVISYIDICTVGATHRCSVCGCLNTQQHMTWYGKGSFPPDEYSDAKCLECV